MVKKVSPELLRNKLMRTRVTQAFLDQLNAYAKARGVNQADIVRNALEKLIDYKPDTPKKGI